jgi:hypothetical protein
MFRAIRLIFGLDADEPYPPEMGETIRRMTERSRVVDARRKAWREAHRCDKCGRYPVPYDLQDELAAGRESE